MVNNSVPFPIEPTFDVNQFNAILSRIKQSMGVFGKDIKLVDEAEFKRQLDAVSREMKTTLPKAGEEAAQKTEQAFDKSTKNIGDMFGKVFQFNMIVQGVQQLAGAFEQFLGPYREFDKQLRNVGTLGVKNFEEFRDAAVELSSSVPDSAAAITEGIYNAISAGAIKVTDGVADIAGGMAFVEQASKLATAGLTDTNSSVKSLAANLNAYGASTDEAARYSDILFNTVNKGVTTIPELNASLAQVVPTAAAFGVAFDQVTAAIATMTQQGVPTAQATTQIRGALVELSKPGAALAPIMEKAGVSLDSLKQEGLQVTLEKLGVAMDEAGLKANQVFSSVEAAGAVLALSGENAQKFATTLSTYSTDAIGSTERAFAVASEGIGNKTQGIMNMIQGAFFKVFDTLGAGSAQVLSLAAQIAPLATTFTALIPLIGTTAMSMLVKLVPATFITTTAAGTATVSFGALATAIWTAMAPILPFVAAAAALGAAIYFIADALHVSTQEQIDEAKATEELIDKQIKQKEQAIQQIDANNKLKQTWEELGQKQEIMALSTEELERFNQVQLELIKRMPGVIDGNKSFADNLEAVNNKLDEANGKANEYKKNLEELAVNKEIAVSVTAKLEAKKMKEEFEDVVNDIGGGGGKGIDFMKAFKLAEGIEAAADSEELASASQKLQEMIWNSTAYSDEEKVRITEAAEAMISQRQAALDQEAKVEETRRAQNLKKFQDQIKQLIEQGAFNIGPYANKEDQARAEAAIGAVAANYGFAKEEAIKLTEEMAKQTDEAKKTADAVGDISESFSESLNAAQKARNEGLAREKDLTLELRKAQQAGDSAKIKDLQEKIRQQRIFNRELDKEADTQEALGKKIDDAYANKTKSTTSFFDKQMKEYNQYKKQQELETQRMVNSIEYLAISEKRNLTDAENLLIQQRKTQELENLKGKATELLSMTENADGTITFAPKIDKRLTKDQKLDSEKLLSDLNKSLNSENKNLIKVKPKLEVLQSELLKADIDRINVEIELGIAQPGDVGILMEQYVKALQSEMAELERKLTEEEDEVKRNALEKQIRDKNLAILNGQLDIQNRIRTEYQKDLANLKDKHSKELELIEENINARKALQDRLIDVAEQSAIRKESEAYDKDMKSLQKKQQDKIINDEFYAREKERRERDHQARLTALQAAANGARIAAERNATLEILAEKESRAKSELAIAEKGDDKELIKQKTAELDAIVKEIQAKGDIFDSLSKQLEGGLTDAFASLFAGDMENLKDSARTMFATLGGILKKEASLAITKMVINYLWQPDGIPWWAKIAAIPAITALIGGAVGAIVDPILGSITSFATGGRIDSPTLIMAGDASRARPGSDSEWVFRDDQIRLLLKEVLYQSTMTDITIQEYYKRENREFLMEALNEMTEGIGRTLTTVMPEKKAYRSIAEQTLYNPALADVMQAENIKMDTRTLENKMDVMIEEMREFSGRIHIVESEVGIASNRYNNRQNKRSVV